MYYHYFRYIVECIGSKAESMIDVGSGNVPYLDWFDWIPKRVSIDINFPYSSASVEGIQGNILEMDFPEKFDICSCMQVLEHIPNPESFCARLMEMGKIVLISVPHKWPLGVCRHHVNDPVDVHSLTRWFGRKPNYHLVVREPFRSQSGERLFAIFDPADPERKFGTNIRKRAK